MTNTKFRKKALLSSVAMLLVALVALGSATFAWFVANPTATASGLTMTTSATAGISVASASLLGLKTSTESYTDAYKSTTFLNATTTTTTTANDGGIAAASANTAVVKNLQPASPFTTPSSNSLNFGTVPAELSSGKDAAATAGDWTSANSDVYSEIIYVKASTQGENDTATVNSAKVTIVPNASTNNTAKYGIKVALVSSSNELIGIWKPTEGDATKTWKGSGDSGKGQAALTTDPYGYTTSGTGKNLTSPLTVHTTLSNTGEASEFVKVYVYLDGENTGVYSDNIPDVTNLLTSISVELSSNTVSGS